MQLHPINSYPSILLNLISRGNIMMANKLHELKMRLLNKKDKVDAPISYHSEDLQPLPHQETPVENPLAKPYQEVQAIPSQSQDDSFSQQKSSKSADKVDKIEEKPAQSIIVQSKPAQQQAVVPSQPVQDQPVANKDASFQSINEHPQQNIVSQQQINDKMENPQNLELIRQPNISASIDEEAKHLIQQKINELSKALPEQEQSKVEKKTKKIVLKQLIKVKECIKNLQSAINGLEYLQQKIQYYPSLKQKLLRYVDELKQLNQ